MEQKPATYRQAGVDIDAASQSVKMIRRWVDSTARPEVIGELGSFGGLFALDTGKYREPVLVSGTDGVGTKLKVAQLLNRHDTVGIDLVAMCVNDILVHGAEPLFFLDYISIGKLRPELVEELVKGVAEGCRQAGCALIGGETAEMPGFYGNDEYDLAGFAVGAVERSRLVDGSHIQEGDVLIGLASNGLHSNGYSLARHVLLDNSHLPLDEKPAQLNESLGEAMLKPTRIYVKSVMNLLERLPVHGMAHITGGGIKENLERVLPANLGASISLGGRDIPGIFGLIQSIGQVDRAEMFRTFNMGVGFILVMSPENALEALQLLRENGEKAMRLGTVIRGETFIKII